MLFLLSHDGISQEIPVNPPFSSETPLYKGDTGRWVGWIQPNVNPPSTQRQPTMALFRRGCGTIKRWMKICFFLDEKT
jgi:hypothetical protein